MLPMPDIHCVGETEAPRGVQSWASLGLLSLHRLAQEKELQSKWVWLLENALEKELGIYQDKGKLSVG